MSNQCSACATQTASKLAEANVVASAGCTE
jgi:hypothetical protein